MANIIMKRGTSSAYKALGTKDGNTLYFLLDTGEIYLGGTLMSVTDLSGKVDAVDGKGLSTNDFTNELKSKLEGLSNQKTFANIVAGSATISADSTADTFTIIEGDNITITADATGDKITISSSYQNDNTTYTLTKSGNKIILKGSDGSSQEVVDSNDNTTYVAATQSAAGLMSAADKTKLDGIDTGANKYSLPDATTTTKGGVIVGDGLSVSGGIISANDPQWDDVQNKPSTFTPSTHGHDLGEISDTTSYVRMTAAERSKLSGIAEGANKYVHPAYTAKNSALYKVTVDATGHVSAVSAATKADITALGIPGENTVYTHPTHEAQSSGLYKITVDDEGHVVEVVPATKSDITALGIPAQDTVYTHPTHTAKSSGFYKVTVDDKGHVSAATAVTKSDITGLGVPAQDTTYTAGTGVELEGTKINVKTDYTTSGKNYAVKADETSGDLYVNVPWTDNNTIYTGANGVTVSGTTISNSGVRSVSAGSTNGTIKVNTNGTNAEVAVKGLGTAAYTASTAYATSAQGAKADSALQASDKNELQGNIDTVSGKVTTLIGDDAGKSVRTIANEELAAQLIAEGADVSLDTLKEIAQWIQDHPKDVAAMNAAIETAQSTADTAKANAVTAQSTADTHIAKKDNPHGVTKAQVGLGNVENKSSATIRGELTAANISDALGYTPADEADAYTHPTYTAKNSGLYKVTIDGTGHVSAATAVSKSDITSLGIPGSDTKYTHPAYTAQDAGMYKVAVDATGHVSEATAITKDDITALGIPAQDTVYTHPAHTAKSSGLYKVTVDDKGHVSAATAVSKSDITALGIPAQDTTYGTASSTAAGLVKIGYAENGKNYPVELSDGKMFVNVPWTDNNTTYTAGTGLALSSGAFSVKTGYTTSGKNYAVAADSDGNLYVNVPWTDNNTVYTHPTYTTKTSGLYKITVDSTGHISAATAVTKSDITGLGIPGSDTNTTYTLSKSGSTISLVDGDGNTVSSVTDSDTNTTYSAATTSAAGLMSASDKAKLDGIDTGANAYSLPTASSSTLGGVKTTSTVTSTSGLTPCPIISGVPYYKDTNTTYSLSTFGVTATASELNILDGVTATASELNVLDGIDVTTSELNHIKGVTSSIQNQLNNKSDSGHTHSSYANQNAFSKATVGSTTITAGATTDTITFAAGSNVTLTPDATNKKITIASTNTTYSDATTSTHGLMSTSDKSKLDGIAAGANNYTHPAYTAKTSGLYKITVDSTGHVSGVTAVSKSDITALGIPSTNTTYSTMGGATADAAGTSGLVPAPAAGKQGQYLRGDGTWATPTNTTYSAATTSAAGLMSANDKSKLDAITASADSVSFSASLTSGTKVGTITINGISTTLYCHTNTNTTYSAGSGLTLSGTTFSVNTGYTTSGKNYAVQVDSTSGGLYVNVPWSDTNTVYTHPSYTAKSSGLYKVTVDATGHVSAATAVTKADITALGIPGSDTNTTYSIAKYNTSGLVKPAYTSTGAATLTTNAASNTTTPTIAAKTTTSGRYYGVEADKNGVLFVNVPWTDTNYTHPSYTAKSSGLYKVTVDATGHVSAATAVTKSDITALGIPGSDTNTTYGIATASTAGLVKPVSVITKPTINSATTTSSRYYHVQMSSDGAMFVNVPWTDSDTKYTHPSHTAYTSGLYKVTVDASGHVTAATAVAKSDITALGIPSSDTNYYGRTANTSSKIYLMGGTSQSSSNKTTYSHDTVFVNTDGHLYSTNSTHSTSGIVALEDDLEWGSF